MEPTIFKFILRHSRKEQILLLLGTLASFPFLYVSLDLPKIIINEAIGGRTFPKVVLGYELDQIPYLMLLCGLFLALVFVNGGFKYFLNVFRGVVGERMLLRKMLSDPRVIGFAWHERRNSCWSITPGWGVCTSTWRRSLISASGWRKSWRT